MTYTIDINLTKAIELTNTLGWRNDMPSLTEIIQMFDLMKKFVSDTKHCLNKKVYKDNDTNQPKEFDYCRDVYKALKDFYLDHPSEEDANLKWKVTFKTIIEPFLSNIKRTYTHEEFIDNHADVITQMQMAFCINNRYEEQPADDVIKAAYFELVSLTKQHQLNALTAVINES